MNKLQCLIVDDEPLARKVLREYIEDIEFLILAGEAENPLAANNLIRKQAIDLLFLDIQMPKMSGLNFLKNLRSAPLAIFTTAYPEYALYGFELDVIDYLVKPISFERFLKAANKAVDFYALKKADTQENKVAKDFFYIKCDKKIEKIDLVDVLYIQSLSNYVIIQTTKKKYTVYLTFKGIEEKLPENQFIRIHRSYLVAVRAIISIDQDEVKLNGFRLPLSQHYRGSVLGKINTDLLRR